MDMQRLRTGMMERYEIADRRPGRVNAVQFGLGEAMLGTVDRLMDDFNGLSPADARVGVAAVQAGEAGYAQKLNAQDGMFTLLVRGYEKETPVKREQVVQCLLKAIDPLGDPDALNALAAEPDLALCLVDDTDAARSLAERFAELRRRAGLPVPPALCLGEAPAGMDTFPALAEGLAFRAEPDEAARQCSEMNYLDDMLHIAEPFARLTLRAPEGFGQRFPLDRVPGVTFADPAELSLRQRLHRALFDGGLFLMAAPGWLNGCDTLADCMKHERLRRFVGEGFTRELMPALGDVGRDTVAQYVTECFERYENPLNRNRLLRCAHHLIRRFAQGPCAALRRLAMEEFEPPRRLSFALAATIMLYAGARENPDTCAWKVARGRQSESIHDDPEVLARFSTLSHDMDPESLAYAALADRELWGEDLREIDGLMERVALDLAAMQREPGFLPMEEA